jgi:hypothetical protein
MPPLALLFAAAVLSGAAAAQALPPLAATDQAAAFRAAGYTPYGRQWVRCQEEGTGRHPTWTLDLVDLNGDGQPEAWITEDSTFCYGNTGTAVTIVTKAPGGWRIVMDEVGVAGVLKTRRAGWADIDLGGPGLGPVPIYRYNGTRYVQAGSHPQ